MIIDFRVRPPFGGFLNDYLFTGIDEIVTILHQNTILKLLHLLYTDHLMSLSKKWMH